MRTAAPMHPFAAFMALETDTALGFRGYFLEGNYCRKAFSRSIRLDMFTQWTVADFAGTAHFHTEFGLVCMGVFRFCKRLDIFFVAVETYFGIAYRNCVFEVGIDLGPVHLSRGQGGGGYEKA